MTSYVLREVTVYNHPELPSLQPFNAVCASPMDLPCKALYPEMKH